mmetsp:Transcript_49810/g.132151  ORF Transcript_49810/g.132151 Transcript_49810/m.132151 type:complete len:324 (+) Transcript_49810:186-1157(+)
MISFIKNHTLWMSLVSACIDSKIIDLRVVFPSSFAFRSSVSLPTLLTALTAIFPVPTFTVPTFGWNSFLTEERWPTGSRRCPRNPTSNAILRFNWHPHDAVLESNLLPRLDDNRSNGQSSHTVAGNVLLGTNDGVLTRVHAPPSPSVAIIFLAPPGIAAPNVAIFTAVSTLCTPPFPFAVAILTIIFGASPRLDGLVPTLAGHGNDLRALIHRNETILDLLFVRWSIITVSPPGPFPWNLATVVAFAPWNLILPALPAFPLLFCWHTSQASYRVLAHRTKRLQCPILASPHLIPRLLLVRCRNNTEERVQRHAFEDLARQKVI